MPLNSVTLSAAIYSAITTNPNNGFSSSFATDVVQQNNVKAFCDSIASAVVAHFTANAVVTVAGVQSGGGTAVGTVA